MDAAVCAKVLQLVNSAYFGLGQKIVSMRPAVTYLGVEIIKSLVLGCTSFSDKAISEVKGFSPDRLQHHSMLTALLAKKIVGNPALADAAFTAGLLHDIGALVLLHAAPPDYVRALERKKELRRRQRRGRARDLRRHARRGRRLSTGPVGHPVPDRRGGRVPSPAQRSGAGIARPGRRRAHGERPGRGDDRGRQAALPAGSDIDSSAASTSDSCAKPASKRLSRRAAPKPRSCSAGWPKRNARGHDGSASALASSNGRASMRIAQDCGGRTVPDRRRWRAHCSCHRTDAARHAAAAASAAASARRSSRPCPAICASTASSRSTRRERLAWNFVPMDRVGVSLLKLDDAQSELLGPLARQRR